VGWKTERREMQMKNIAKRMLSRVVPNIRYGTERFPEGVARRLSILNVVTWIMAASLLFFTVVHFVAGRFGAAVVTGIFALIFAAIPLLHRFGPWMAANVFVILWLAYTWRVTTLNGTGGGHFTTFMAAGLTILVYGLERPLWSIAVTLAAIATIIAQQLLLPADTGFLPPGILLAFNFPINVIVGAASLFGIVYYAMSQVARAEAATEREYVRSEALLANILPASVAVRLKSAPQSEIADAFEEASILFADMAGYTARASDVTPSELVRFLNTVYTRFDTIVERYGLEKIKTSGDSYMAVSGVPVARPDHAAALALLAIEMRDAASKITDTRGRAVSIRIGLASGPVVAGVVGMRKWAYDVWGDAVNIASRMESTGEPGKIHVAPSTYELLKDQFDFVARDPIEVRGKGYMQTWFLAGPRKMQ